MYVCHSKYCKNCDNNVVCVFPTHNVTSMTCEVIGIVSNIGFLSANVGLADASRSLLS